MPNPISSSFFGVTNFEAYRRPAYTQAGNGVILNGIFYPWELKQFTQTSTAGGLGYLLTAVPGRAYFIRDFYWIYSSGAENPVVQFSMYDSTTGFKRWWFLTDIITVNSFKIQHFDVNMLMPSQVQFTHTFTNEALTVTYMEIDLYVAIVPSIIQVSGLRESGDEDVEKECLLMDWITGKCDVPNMR